MTKPVPAHHTPKGFKNLNGPETESDKSVWQFLKMRVSTQYADHQTESNQVPVVPIDRRLIATPPGPQATWLGHSTYLIQVNGTNILTDPVFSERASPISWWGPRRYTPPAIGIDELPRIDYVLISHNHYDHLDLESIRAIGNDALWLIPLKNGALLESVGVTNYVELDWWDTHSISEWKFTATPVQHWSARGINDRFECLWSGWAAQHNDFSFYFAGDTGYNAKDFKETGRRFGSFDLALIPIGAYAPRSFMKLMHVDPFEAVQIHQDVNSRFSLALHWGTFPLTAESPGEPPVKLREALRAANLSPDSFLAVPIGSTTRIPD